MRDIALCIVFLAAVPFMLKRPSLGVIMWIWLSVMNPHRLTYGFAFDLNFAAAAAKLRSNAKP
jgi:putative inorganic carbon (hco3(-)) transporter